MSLVNDTTGYLTFSFLPPRRPPFILPTRHFMQRSSYIYLRCMVARQEIDANGVWTTTNLDVHRYRLQLLLLKCEIGYEFGDDVVFVCRSQPSS